MDFLEHYGEQSLVYRVVKQRTIVDKLHEINEKVGEVFNSVGMVTTVSWREQFEKDTRVLNEVLEAMARDTTGVLRELKGFRAREEALLTLKFEVERREDEHGEELVLLMRKMIATIGGEEASTAALPGWFVPLYELEMETDPFARGTFGSVYRGLWKSGTAVVVKRVQIDSMEVDEGVQLKIVKELDKLHELIHPNLIKMFGASHVATPPYLVCEEATNGNLGTFLARSAENKQQMWVLLYQAAMGLDHLHKAGIVHGDLKLNNILVGSDGQAKVADFGLKTMRTYSRLPSSPSGGLRWRAPECLKRRPTFSSDVYSLGMCIIAAELGEPPFAFLSDDDGRDNMRRNEIPDKPERMADCVWELVDSMTKASSTQRLPLEAVIDQLQVLARAGPADPQGSNSAENGSPISADCVSGVSPSEESSLSFGWIGDQRPLYSPTTLADQLSVGDVVNTLTKSSVIAQETALIFLIQACLDPEQRKLLHESNGFPVLVELVKFGSTDFIKVCALGCLGWCTELDCSFPESDFENLQEQVCNSTAQQYSHLAEDLRHDSLSTKLKPVISCACVAELRGSEVLQDAGVVAPLVALLTQTDEALTLWSMDAVGNVADNNEMRGAFAREGAIPPLLELLKTGTNDQTALAAYALGSLASGHDDNNVAIVGSGAIAGLIELLTGDTDMQRNFAAFALESLAEGDHEANWLTMANEGAIPALLGLLRTGTSIQKSHAVSTLGSLASSDENCVRIAREGIIPDLVSLFQQGTTNQKERAVGALFYLSRSVKNSKRFLNGGCIAPLLESIESGTEEQVEHAIYALGNLASHTTDNGKVIVENGAISPLKEVLRTGTEVQKGVAAFTLRLLSTVSETIRLTIGDEETMKLLVQLLLTTSGEQKDLVVSAVCYLTKHGNGDLQAIKSDAVVPHLVELLHRRAPKHQTFYATVLGRFASDEAFRTLIGIKGGIPPLVKLLRTGNASNKEKAAIALGRLAVGNPANKDEIVRLGAVTLLEKLRRTGTRQQKCTATTALADIEDDNEAQPRRTRRRAGA
ncbi:hypothetical protein PF008_g19686 [Phytophthora fragariae]|uniref:Protein kinase domain-containing protein n=1 Tax=Phytophthora fragariae TaxID=53985 RepID=A0A6G0R1N9_9STRA|nr:hypothetical protein PF008_g19686 [Phytophthora fragariae]